MANDDVNAIAGASVPVPLTILSDSSKFLLIAIATSLISSKSACCLIKLLSSANWNSTSRVKSGSIALNGISTNS